MGSDFWPHLFNSSYNVGINLKKEELLTMSVNSFCACMKIRLFFLRRREISRKHHQTALTNAVCQQTATNYHPPLPFCASKTRFKHREEFPVGLSKSPDETRLRDEISPARSVTNTWGKWKKKKKKEKKTRRPKVFFGNWISPGAGRSLGPEQFQGKRVSRFFTSFSPALKLPSGILLLQLDALSTFPFV